MAFIPIPSTNQRWWYKQVPNVGYWNPVLSSLFEHPWRYILQHTWRVVRTQHHPIQTGKASDNCYLQVIPCQTKFFKCDLCNINMNLLHALHGFRKIRTKWRRTTSHFLRLSELTGWEIQQSKFQQSLHCCHTTETGVRHQIVVPLSCLCSKCNVAHTKLRTKKSTLHIWQK
jgi:hypothetical protein